MLTRRLVLGASAALAAIVLIGLGDGALAAWFRAAGGGAAVGFAIAVLAKAQAGDTDLKDVTHRFNTGTLAFIVSLGAVGALINFVVIREEAEQGRISEARSAVSRFISGQGFWAGQPAILDTTVRSFGDALHDRMPVRHGQVSPRTRDITHTVTRGPLDAERTLEVEGMVCSRYGLVPNAVNTNFKFRYTYRLVSPGGRDEVHVVSDGDATTIIRGATVRITGLMAAAGPRRDNGARNTVFVLGLTAAQTGSADRDEVRADRICGDAP